MMGAARHSRRRGFTLVEAIAALALMGLLLAALSTITGQWLPTWRRGFGVLQSWETLDVGLERLTADLAAARFVTARETAAPPLFFGAPTTIAFVRSEIGPNAGLRLEWVHWEEVSGAGGPELLRTRAAYAPIADSGQTPAFSDAVAAVRAPWRVRFAFAGADGHWQAAWVNQPRLPRAVRIEVFDGETRELSTIAALHVDAPAACVGKLSVETCLSDLARGAP